MQDHRQYHRKAWLASDRIHATPSGYLARALQHEIDHLDGVLYIDRIGTVKRGLLRNKLAEIRKRGAAGEMRTTEEEVAAEE